MIIQKENIPERCHLTNTKLKIKKIRYPDDIFKPAGFWYGLKHYWVDFYTHNYERTKSRKFNISGYLYKLAIPKSLITTIDKPDKNKILLISNVGDLKSLESTYKRLYEDMPETYFIDWPKIKKLFGGVEIHHNPWQNKGYLPLWYSAWDVPSGCIWSYSVLKKIKFSIIHFPS